MIDGSTDKYSSNMAVGIIYTGLVIMFALFWISMKLMGLFPVYSEIDITLASNWEVFVTVLILRSIGALPSKKSGVISQKKRSKRAMATIHISGRKKINDPVTKKQIINIIEGVTCEISAQKSKGMKTIIIESHLLSIEFLSEMLESKIRKEITGAHVTFEHVKTGRYPIYAIPFFYWLMHWKIICVYKHSGKFTIHL
ncbi:hypothetical protein RJE46_24815 (plasmid) [Cedecea neteri]|uniref:hypothetical protein n=1 Tax=Cedecea neteri TaxID=158822 RepID=UPI002893757B|nr:hypothetical protein [Cedecea neteri]WNJ82296.1 hypothetical protein RJE46_24815 [Cedecea neteri]